MKKYNILYDWPIDHINFLCESSTAENFATSLGEGNRQDEFIRLTEEMLEYGKTLDKARENKILFLQWEGLRSCIKKFEDEFKLFPDSQLLRFGLSLLVSDLLSQVLAAATGDVIVLDEGDIDDEMFELRSLSDALPITWFVRQNAKSFGDSIIVFSCHDLVKLEESILNSTISPELSFHLLRVLCDCVNVPTPYAVLVKKQNPTIDSAAVNAFAKLAILSSGCPVHCPRDYALSPHVIDLDAIRAGTQYQQLNDVFYVLSEYNSRKELLTKYLTLYHVIENFMYKMPIVELENQQGGRLFSIRDFRRLYKRLDDNELSSLKRLVDVAFKLLINPSNTFEQHIISRWLALVPGVSIMDINKTLGVLDVKKDRRSLRHSEFAKKAADYFAQMVYAVRNAIVHNKETEFHLSYATLDPTLCVLIEKFLIPSLEEICFALVSTRNPHVWYQNKALVLY